MLEPQKSHWETYYSLSNIVLLKGSNISASDSLQIVNEFGDLWTACWFKMEGGTPSLAKYSPCISSPSEPSAHMQFVCDQETRA